MTPRLAYWDFAALPLDRTTAAIGVLRVEMHFAPEPRAALLLAAGLGCLLALWRVRKPGNA